LVEEYIYQIKLVVLVKYLFRERRSLTRQAYISVALRPTPGRRNRLQSTLELAEITDTFITRLDRLNRLLSRKCFVARRTFYTAFTQSLN